MGNDHQFTKLPNVKQINFSVTPYFFVKRDSSEENIGIFMLGCKELRFSASIYTWSWRFKNFGVGQARRKSLWNLTLSLALFVYVQWRDRGSNLTTPDPDVSRILELDKQEESLSGILLWAWHCLCMCNDEIGDQTWLHLILMFQEFWSWTSKKKVSLESYSEPGTVCVCAMTK